MMINKAFLIAGVATLALSMPAQARPDRDGRGERAERSERQAERAERREARQQRSEARPQRAERREARQQRVEQRQQRAQRVERRAERSERREQRVERRQPQLERRAERVERRRERVERQSPRVERRADRIERRPQRVERERPRLERRANRVERRQERIERRAPRLERRAERIERRQDRNLVREQRIDRRQERQAFRELRRDGRQERRVAQQLAERREDRREVLREMRQDQRQAFRARTWEQNVTQRFDRWDDDDRRERRQAIRQAFAQSAIGPRIDPVWFDDYVPVRYRTSYYDTPDYFYRTDWDDGYLYRVDRDTNLVAALIPLLGGAYSIGNTYPVSYNSYYGNPYYHAGYSPYYNVPLGYRSFYYDTPDYYYRYGGGAIYQIDPTTQLITAIAALLTGANFNIGQPMPLGYDVYNVPYAYRDRYFDTNDAWYRYDDGFIYQVDPYSRLVMNAYPASYSPFSVGYAVPNDYWDPYYSDYNVPYAYRDVYYDTDDDYYRYYNGGIYQVDPTTRMVQALVALATGTQLGVGQALPVGYDVYNVPWQYRTTYYDTPDSWYRYNDGYIYRVDPTTRLIQEVIRAIA